jgi:hypothetical protein
MYFQSNTHFMMLSTKSPSTWRAAPYKNSSTSAESSGIFCGQWLAGEPGGPHTMLVIKEINTYLRILVGGHGGVLPQSP